MKPCSKKAISGEIHVYIFRTELEVLSSGTALLKCGPGAAVMGPGGSHGSVKLELPCIYGGSR